MQKQISDQSNVPLLDELQHDEIHGDIESKPLKVVEKPAAEETSFNTQAFWLLVWMSK